MSSAEHCIPKVLYHLTDIEHLAGICRDGLIPCIGCNSSIIGDNRNAVFLCEKKDVGKWHIILRKPVLLEIHNFDFSTADFFEYSSYGEYMISEVIPPKYIKLVKGTVTYTDEDMYALCESYLLTISEFTILCARNIHGESVDSETLDFIRCFAHGVTSVVDNLDYSIRNMSVWEDFLRAYGSEGEYTFCDTYGNTSKRLWEVLPLYKIDELHRDFVRIYDFIKDTFPFARELCTGGLEVTPNKNGMTAFFS